MSGLIWVLEPWVRRHDVGLGIQRERGRSIYQGPPLAGVGTGGLGEPTA